MGLYKALLKMGFLPSQVDNESILDLMEVLSVKDPEGEKEERKVFQVEDW